MVVVYQVTSFLYKSISLNRIGQINQVAFRYQVVKTEVLLR